MTECIAGILNCGIFSTSTMLLRFPSQHQSPKRSNPLVFSRRLRICSAKWQPLAVPTHDTVLNPKTDARRTTPLPWHTDPRIAVIAFSTGDSRTKRESAQHRAPTAGRETAAIGVKGGRRLLHNHRPLNHH